MATNIQYPVSGSYQINIKAEDQCGNLTEEVRVISVRDKYYTISYDSKGGSSFSPDRVIEEGSITSFPQPTKDGYTFSGWFDNEFCYGDPLTEIDPVTKDYILYAKWNNAGYSTFVFNSPANVKTLGINVPVSRLNEYTTQYGSVVETYPAWSEDDPYVFINPNDRYWASYRSAIQTVVIASEIRPEVMDYWFDGFTAVTSIINAPYIMALHIASMKCTFRDCQNLRNIDLSTWRTESLTVLQSAFQGCLHYDNWAKDFHTGLVDDFSYCFASTGVQNEGETPQGLLMENYIDLQSWDFRSATNLAGMFSYAYCDEIYLPTVGISEFSLPTVTSVNTMFSHTEAVRIYSKDFVFGVPTVTSNRMFGDAVDIIGAQGTLYSESHIDKSYARVDDVFADLPGYFRGEVECTLTFEVNGGISLSPRLCKGGEVYNLPTTTKTGYDLEGWYIDPTFQVLAGSTGFRCRVPHSMRLYAKWKESGAETNHYLFADGVLVLGVPNAELEEQINTHGQMIQKFENDPSAAQSIFYSHRSMITSVQCGAPKVLLQPTEGAFKDFSELVVADISSLVAQPALDFTSMFEHCLDLQTCNFSINGEDNPIVSMANMFKDDWHLTALTMPTLPRHTDYPLVRMDAMFRGCRDLATRVDLSTIYMNDVTDMSWLFYQCTSLPSVKLPADLDTQNCTALQYLFGECRSLNEVINHELIDTRSAQYLTGMWGYTQLEVLDCSKYSTASAIGVGGIFMECSQLKTIYAGDEFIMRPSITSTRYVFSNCRQLVGGNGTAWQSSYDDDGNMMWIDGKDGTIGLFTAKNFGTSYAVYNSTTKTITFFRDTPDKYTHRQVIGDKTYFKNIEAVTDWSEYWPAEIKSGCEYVESDNHVEFEMAGAKSMFNGFTAVKTIDLRPMNFNGTDMSSLFKGCRLLRDIWFGEGWHTDNVTVMALMFSGCSALRTAELAEAMKYWRAEEVRNCTAMFNECSSLLSIDLTNFGFASTYDTSYMFNNCTHVTTITVDASKSFVLDSITDGGMMFGSCNVLVGQNGTRFSSSYTGKQRAVIDLPSQPGYLTAG